MLKWMFAILYLVKSKKSKKSLAAQVRLARVGAAPSPACIDEPRTAAAWRRQRRRPADPPSIVSGGRASTRWVVVRAWEARSSTSRLQRWPSSPVSVG